MDTIHVIIIVFDLGGRCVMFLLSLTIFHLDLRINHSQDEGNNVSTESIKVTSYCFTMVQAIQIMQDSNGDAIRAPPGPSTRAHARKMKDALQVFVRVVKDQVGAYKAIEGIDQDNTKLMNLLQVNEDL